MRAATSKRRELVHPDDLALPASEQTVFVVERLSPTVLAALNDRHTVVHRDPDDPSAPRKIDVGNAALMVDYAAAALVEIRNLLDGDGKPLEVPTEVHPISGQVRVARAAIDAMLDLNTLVWLSNELQAEKKTETERGKPLSPPTSSTTTKPARRAGPAKTPT